MLFEWTHILIQMIAGWDIKIFEQGVQSAREKEWLTYLSNVYCNEVQ